MKNKNLFSKGYLCLLFLTTCLRAQNFTITTSATATSTTPGNISIQTNSTQIVIPENVTAQILHLHESVSGSATPNGGFSGAGYLTIQVNNLNFKYTESTISENNNQPVITGPALITLIASADAGVSINNGSTGNALAQDNMICSMRTNQPVQCNTNYFVPNTGVVIPADSSGPVNIILESSVDLINWIPADPGTYGTTTSNRFFRVRATR